jgi:hypothetical protein
MNARDFIRIPVLAALAAGLALAAASGLGAEGRVTPWKPAGISSPQWESHPAFDPVNRDFYFVRSSPKFEGWRLLVSHCTAAGWSEPRPPAFADPGAAEADPWFTPDGGTLYFISARKFAGKKGNDLDIWRVTRQGEGWGPPERLPDPVNSEKTEWFPRLSADGRLYFGSNRDGGLGGNDIWRATTQPDGRWAVENLGPGVNTAGDEYEPLPSADGQTLLVATADGFFRSHRVGDGWPSREKLGAGVNVNGTEIGPLFSPEGGAVLFSRDAGSPDSGEFFVWRERGTEDWPPDCP